MPKDITGSIQTDITPTATIAEQGDISSAARFEAFAQDTLNDIVTLKDLIAGGGSISITVPDNGVNTAKLQDESVTEQKLDISNNPIPGTSIIYDNSNEMTWGTPEAATHEINWTPNLRSDSTTGVSGNTFAGTAFRVGKVVLFAFQFYATSTISTRNNFFFDLPYGEATGQRVVGARVSIDTATTNTGVLIASNNRIRLIIDPTAAYTNKWVEVTGTYVATASTTGPVIAGGTVADGAITTPKLANDCVTQIKMADNSVGTDQLIDVSVTEQKMAVNSVGTAQIKSSSISSEHIVNNSIQSSDMFATGTRAEHYVLKLDDTRARFTWGLPYYPRNGRSWTPVSISQSTGSVTSVSGSAGHINSFTDDIDVVGVTIRLTATAGSGRIQFSGLPSGIGALPTMLCCSIQSTNSTLTDFTYQMSCISGSLTIDFYSGNALNNVLLYASGIAFS